MRVLILGGSGMLGHKLWQTLSPRFDTHGTFRRAPEAYARFGIFDESRAVGGLAADNVDSFARALAAIRPEVVVNCIGIVKQDEAAHDPVPTITVNALFPHKLAKICRAAACAFDSFEHRLRLLWTQGSLF